MGEKTWENIPLQGYVLKTGVKNLLNLCTANMGREGSEMFKKREETIKTVQFFLFHDTCKNRRKMLSKARFSVQAKKK